MISERLSLGYLDSHPEDAATSLERINHEDMCEFIAALPPRTAAVLIRHLTPISGASCLARLPEERAIEVLERLPADLATPLIRRLPPDKRHHLMEHPELPVPLRGALRYPEESVGSIMRTDALVLPLRFTVSEARRHMRKHTAKIFNRIFVTDENQVLKGFVELKDLMFASNRVALGQLIRRPNIRLSVRDRYEAIHLDAAFQQAEVHPVVGYDNRLMGILTHDDLERVLEDLPDTGAGQNLAGDLLELLEIFCDTCAVVLDDLDDARRPGEEIHG